MNEIVDRTLKGQPLSGAYLAADGSGTSGAPRNDEPPRGNGIDLGDMLEMGLESLLMHFRRRPQQSVMPGKPHAESEGDSAAPEPDATNHSEGDQP